MKNRGLHRGLRGAILGVCLLLGAAALSASPGAGTGPVNLTDVFTADDTLSRATGATFQELEICGPEPVPMGNISFVEKSFAGIRWAGFPDGTDPTDPTNLETKTSRLTVQFWYPNDIDFSDADSAWLFLNQAGDPTSTGDVLRIKQILARKLARLGIPSLVWFEHDLHPKDPKAPVLSVARQLGFPNDGLLLHEGLTWMQLKDPAVEPLTIQDFRFHFRFGMAQGYMLATTFVQRFMEDQFGAEALPWTAAIKTVLAGGSKRGTAALTASGVDSRVRAARVSGSQSFNAGPLGAWARYFKDWNECPGGQLGTRADFTSWSERNQDNTPSYYDVYAPSRDPQRYAHVFFLDIVGTHDYINPLGAHSTFWTQYDGLVNGVPDGSEERWDYRIIRRPNRNHGYEYDIGTVGRFDVSASLVLVWRFLRHLVQGRDFPRIDLASMDLTGTQSYTTRVRVSGDQDPVDEQYTVFLAVSDDRDFRRCTLPALSLPNGQCFDGQTDDNKEEEDYFVPIQPSSVTVDGEFRDLVFDIPPEVAALGPDPLFALFVELKIEGNNPNRFGDDIWVHTEVGFVNDGLYGEGSCP